MPRTTEWYGWVPDIPDKRDFRFSTPLSVMGAMPVKIDLRPGCPPVLNQGTLGSCTANAIIAAHMFGQKKQGADDPVVLSRLFVYWNERDMEGAVGVDSGAQIRDGMKSIADLGACLESLWPYNIMAFRDKPSPPCYEEALKHQAVTYYRVDQEIGQMKGCLAAGFPFVFGFSVYDSFESEQVAKTGVLGMPKKEERMRGGHAVLCVGYDDTEGTFIVQNSWGDDWGREGFFTIPQAYLADGDLAADMWTIRLVEV